MDNKFYIPEDKIKFEEYFSIFENINEAVCINTKDGIIFFVNHSTLELFGYTKEEMIGMNISNLYANPKDRPSIIRILEKDVRIKDFPVKLKKKNGQIIDCEFIKISINDVYVKLFFFWVHSRYYKKKKDRRYDKRK